MTEPRADAAAVDPDREHYLGGRQRRAYRGCRRTDVPMADMRSTNGPRLGLLDGDMTPPLGKRCRRPQALGPDPRFLERRCRPGSPEVEAVSDSKDER